MRRPDPHRALLRVLAAGYPGLIVLASRAEPWASATFTGARHEIEVCAGADLAGIKEAEFDLRGHIVADIAWCRTDGRASIEALTIEVE